MELSAYERVRSETHITKRTDNTKNRDATACPFLVRLKKTVESNKASVLVVTVPERVGSSLDDSTVEMKLLFRIK